MGQPDSVEVKQSEGKREKQNSTTLCPVFYIKNVRAICIMNFILQETCSFTRPPLILLIQGKIEKVQKQTVQIRLVLFNLKSILKFVLKKHVVSNKSLRKVANCQKQGKYEATLNHRDIFKTAMEILLHLKTYFTLQTV